jgi:hypothetical protein
LVLPFISVLVAVLNYVARVENALYAQKEVWVRGVALMLARAIPRRKARGHFWKVE